MPKSIRGDEPVIDPLKAAPKLNSGELADPPQVPFTEPAPARAVVKRRKGQQPEIVLPSQQPRLCGGRTGHQVSDTAKFCPECGVEIRAPDAPLTCRNGHEVTPEFKFCATCGVPLATEAVFPALDGGQLRPRPDSELTAAEREDRNRQHARAVEMGNSLGRAQPEWCPSGGNEYLFHILDDGFTAFGQVWFRGQEISIGPDHPRWPEAKQLFSLDTAAQYRRWGHEVFRPGPWPGERSYTAAAGKFQSLKSLDGEGEVAQPTTEELARADAAERARAGRVPAPLRF